MLFFHNITKRKKIQNYVFTIIGVLLLSAILETVFLFIKNKRIELINREENRSILFADTIDCSSLDDYEVTLCEIKDERTLVVFKTLMEKTDAEKYFHNKTDLVVYSDQYETEENIMGVLINISKFIIFLLAVIIFIVEYMLIEEDKKIIFSLRSIGYNNKKILVKTLNALNLFYLPLVMVSFIFFLVIFLILYKYLSNLPIINYVALTYLIFFAYADIVYILLYKVLKRK